MIYGIIPVGGKGTRLGLPYSKEMLPQKNYDYYNPVINHLVEKMEMAGAERIYFVHGLEYKQDVVDYFSNDSYCHIKQTELGFAKVLSAAFTSIENMSSADSYLFGLPDSVFDGNPFVEMLLKPGIVCGLFTTDDHSKVDRLNTDLTAFQVKTVKTENNTDWFWGLIKFDYNSFLKIAAHAENTNEIGDILNQFNRTYVKSSRYVDLGTWNNYNRYLSDNHNFSNIELEKKYDATNINVKEFCKVMDSFNIKDNPYDNYKAITSTDFYYKNNNPNIEFIRYREPSSDLGAVGDITIKNFRKSQLNRFELTIKLDNPVTQNVLQFMRLIGADFEFEVTKKCSIYEWEEATIVMYSFEVVGKTYKILEVELNTSDMTVLDYIEQQLAKTLDGFNPSSIITLSKYQMIKKELENVSAS